MNTTSDETYNAGSAPIPSPGWVGTTMRGACGMAVIKAQPETFVILNQ